MSLRPAVAAPFRTEGVTRLGESEFVVALSLDRGWFSPDQPLCLVDLAAGEGLIQRDGEALVATFDPAAVAVPADFAPEEDVLRERSTFERILETITDAGIEKRTAVGEINGLQADLGVTLGTAAVVYARREGLAVEDVAERVREEL
jgi:hypothetical protein